jgi:cell wall-associated NlpC family hydrolase
MKRIYAVAISLAMLVATPGIATAGPNQQAIDYVISRALSQRGVPYTYGGGNASGPSASTVPDPSVVADANSLPGLGAAPGTGFGQEAGVAQFATVPLPGTAPSAGTVPTVGTAPTPGVVGFDASGLIQYAFASVGIKMPRSSGEQYKVGRKVLPSQALPGDLIFYGPDGNQSVAMFIGNGQMLEATNPAVTVSPVRTKGMTPYLARMIDP